MSTPRQRLLDAKRIDAEVVSREVVLDENDDPKSMTVNAGGSGGEAGCSKGVLRASMPPPPPVAPAPWSLDADEVLDAGFLASHSVRKLSQLGNFFFLNPGEEALNILLMLSKSTKPTPLTSLANYAAALPVVIERSPRHISCC